MDDNELDYYRHDIQCSNTCKSNKTQPQDSTGSSISRDSSMSSVNPSSHPSSFDENPPRYVMLCSAAFFDINMVINSIDRSQTKFSIYRFSLTEMASLDSCVKPIETG